MQVCIFFLKLGFHWTFPGNCTVGTSLGGTTREILGGFPGRVLSINVKNIFRTICLPSNQSFVFEF